MKIIASNNQAMLNFIGHACNNADTRQTGLDVFGFVKIVSSNGELSITGSNGNQTFIRISDSADVQADSDGEVCIEASKMFQVARSLPKDKPVTIAPVPNKDRVAMTAGRSRLQLKTVDSTQYPTIQTLDQTQKTVEVVTHDLINAISNTLYAAGRNDVRAYLNCINLKMESGLLKASSSDGHRLVINSVNVADTESDMDLLLPVNSMQVLARLPAISEVTKISFCHNRAEFNMGGLIYRTSIVEDKFPDLNRVIPTSIASTTTVNRDDFMDVLKRMMVLVADQKSPKIKISTTTEQINMQTVIDHEDDGLGEDMLGATTSGDEVNYPFGINPKYILDAISHIETEEVILGFNGENSPCSITSSSNGSHTQSIVMPLRL